MPPVSQSPQPVPQQTPPTQAGPTTAPTAQPQPPVAPQPAPVIGSNAAPQTPQSKPAQKQQATTNPNSTQNTLLISEIRDNIVIMKDGSFRAVVACQSINFDLMSSREREGVEYSYQNFLNSLYFPIQIFIRSERVDIGPYIDRLVQIRRRQDNMLLNVLMDDYINFIDVLSQEANIMEKSFYVAIPYFPTGDLTDVRKQATGFFAKIFAKPQTGPTKIDEASYQKAKDELKNRVDSVTSGLFQIGVKSTQLDTKQLGELYYNIYNPDTAVREPLTNPEQSTGTYVKKGTGEATQAHLQEGGM